VTDNSYTLSARDGKTNVVPMIGRNVLLQLRITIDSPQQMSYWERRGALDTHDLDCIGLTLLSRQRRGYCGDVYVGDRFGLRTYGEGFN
jgi:hypothetical protein